MSVTGVAVLGARVVDSGRSNVNREGAKGGAMPKPLRATVLGLWIVLSGAAAFAQVVTNPNTTNPKLWGNGLTAYVVSSAEFTPFDPSVTWAPVPASPYRYVTGGSPPQLIAPVHLPQGVSVIFMVVEGCDTTDPGFVTGDFWSAPQPGGPSTLVVDAGGGAGSTGCLEAVSFLPTPLTIDNTQNLYYLTLQNSTTDGSTYVTSIHLLYTLQVSPGPATPTFNDVPTTDPAFQYIEAMAASGITSGCGGGNYCPDNPVTRRQMAVFFAKALGLFWPL
jgi:hypothetical protein